MKVQAMQLGYYQHKRRREGDVFTLVPIKSKQRDPKTGEMKEIVITPEQQFSKKWMKNLDEAPAKKGKGKSQNQEPEVEESEPSADEEVI